MIERMLESDERILWRGTPDRLVYTIGSPSFYIFAFFWGVIDIFLITLMVTASKDGGGPPVGFVLPFFTLHLMPVWIAVFGPLYRFFACGKVEYLLTNKRIYIQSGLVGTDIRSLELYEVQNLAVDVGVIQKMRGVGTILLTKNAEGRSGGNAKNKLLHIENPYEIYKLIQRVSLDVTTDYQFPNAYRPEENKGYQTKYNPEERYGK